MIMIGLGIIGYYLGKIHEASKDRPRYIIADTCGDSHNEETALTLFDRTLWKFLLVGVANTLFGTAVMFLFYNVLHLSYWLSSFSNYFFGSILSYVLNRKFTFRSHGTAAKTLPRFVVNIILCYLLAYGIARPAAARMLSGCSQPIQENAAMLVGMCLFVGLNYIGQRFFVFKTRPPSSAR